MGQPGQPGSYEEALRRLLVDPLRLRVTKINILLTIFHNEEERLWELVKWSARGKCFDLLSNSLSQFFMEIWKICMWILGVTRLNKSWEMGLKFNWLLTNQVQKFAFSWLLEISEILTEDWGPAQTISLRAGSFVRRQNVFRTSEPARG